MDNMTLEEAYLVTVQPPITVRVKKNFTKGKSVIAQSVDGRGWSDTRDYAFKSADSYVFLKEKSDTARE